MYVLFIECGDVFGILGNQSHPLGGVLMETYTHRSQSQSLTFIVLLAGEPEASVEVPQHVLVLASLPDVVNGVGQLLPLYPGQFLLLHRRQCHVGSWVSRVWRGGLWCEKRRVKKSHERKEKRERQGEGKGVGGRQVGRWENIETFKRGERM